jgi:hypothetical protein
MIRSGSVGKTAGLYISLMSYGEKYDIKKGEV